MRFRSLGAAPLPRRPDDLPDKPALGELPCPFGHPSCDGARAGCSFRPPESLRGRLMKKKTLRCPSAGSNPHFDLHPNHGWNRRPEELPLSVGCRVEDFSVRGVTVRCRSVRKCKTDRYVKSARPYGLSAFYVCDPAADDIWLRVTRRRRIFRACSAWRQ